MDVSEAKEEEPTLAAWRRWVQGPFVAITEKAKLKDRIEEWTLQFMEDLDDEDVPEGAVPALAARAGVTLEHRKVLEEMAVHRERRKLQPHFVQGMFIPYSRDG